MVYPGEKSPQVSSERWVTARSVPMLDTQEEGCVNCTMRWHARATGVLGSQLAMGRDQQNGSELNTESDKDEGR